MKNFKRFNFHLDPMQIERLEGIAKKQEVTTSAVVRKAIASFADAWEKKYKEQASNAPPG